jgi:glutathione synthase/RimK-type ligase-like ATP-grasp enzyme
VYEARVRIAFLTSSHFSDLYEDDRLAADELERLGHQVSPAVWTETPAAALDAFDVVVMRSPWDWFHRRLEFRRYLESLRTTRARVVNAPQQLLDFADKTYLARLQAQGVDVVPTVQLLPSELQRVPELLAQKGWARAVLKPAFTANAVGAHLFDAERASPVVDEVLASGPVADEPFLLQPFVPSIAKGELSFIFFGGVFSHAVKKSPRSGDWRVQHDYGGVSEPFTPSERDVEAATRLLTRSAPGSVYGRVDAVEWQGRLHVMELELVEPELFFRHDAQAPARFAAALLR